jgi:hypothetical protein
MTRGGRALREARNNPSAARCAGLQAMLRSRGQPPDIPPVTPAAARKPVAADAAPTARAAFLSPWPAQGRDARYASAIHRRAAMPASGGNPALPDAGIEVAVDYILAQSR